MPPMRGGAVFRSIFDVSRNTYELMTQTVEFGLCGCRINPQRCLRKSSEIHAAGEREIRIFKGFRCRPSILAERCRLSVLTPWDDSLDADDSFDALDP